MMMEKIEIGCYLLWFWPWCSNCTCCTLVPLQQNSKTLKNSCNPMLSLWLWIFWIHNDWSAKISWLEIVGWLDVSFPLSSHVWNNEYQMAKGSCINNSEKLQYFLLLWGLIATLPLQLVSTKSSQPIDQLAWPATVLPKLTNGLFVLSFIFSLK